MTLTSHCVMKFLAILVIAATSFAQVSTSVAEWNSHIWENENLGILEEGINLCQRFNEEEGQLCETTIKNFLSLMLKSNNIKSGQQIQVEENVSKEKIKPNIVIENPQPEIKEVENKIQLSTLMEQLMDMKSKLELFIQNVSQTKSSCTDSNVLIEKLINETVELKLKLVISENHLTETNTKLLNSQESYSNIYQQFQEANEKLKEMNISESNCKAELEHLQNEMNLTKSGNENSSIATDCQGSSTPKTEPKLNITKAIPPGAVTLSTGVYLFENRKLFNSDAREFCKSKGMDLAAIETEEENIAIATYANFLRSQGRSSLAIHTSGCYSHQHGGFVWRSTGQPLTFVKWYESRNRGPYSENHCIQLRTEYENWGIYNDEEGFVCELL